MIKTTPSDFRLQTSFTLKIIFKIFVKMSSLQGDPQETPPAEQRTVAHFQSRFLF